MTSRTVDLVVFGVCAGVTGVWSLLAMERLYFFLMFIGVVALLRHRSALEPTTREDDPITAKRIEALVYAQGLKHGQARAQARLNKKGGQHLPEAG